MEQQTSPRYLYKVLTLENWEKSHGLQELFLAKDDETFIHFSTEEQLGRIIEKFFGDQGKVIVLVLETAKLPGRLVLEANPGGKNKYYHLYNGSIPWSAVVEERVIERIKPAPGSLDTGKPLKIVQVGETVLRAKARSLTKEEIAGSEIQALIEKMKRSMRQAPGVGLAAPQIGCSIQLMVVEDRAEYHTKVNPELLKKQERQPVPFHVLINPKLTLGEGEAAEFFEGCLSVPGLVAVVPRARSVTVEGLNEKGEPVVIEATGWYARILQHEIDHLNGLLFVDRAKLETLMTRDNYLKLWRDVPVKETESAFR